LWIKEFTVSLLDNDIALEPETYKVINTESCLEKNEINSQAPIVQAILNNNCKTTRISLSKDVFYLVIDVKYEQNLEELIDYYINQSQLNEEDTIYFGWKLVETLVSSIEISKDLNGIFTGVVSAHLNTGDIENAILWVKRLEELGNSLNNIKEKLEIIAKKKMGKHIDDINNPFVLREIANLHKELGAIKRAKLILLRALDIDTKNIYVLTTLAATCKDLRDYEEGIYYCERALSINNFDYVTLNTLGALYRKTRKFPLAVQCYKRSIEINDINNSHAHVGLGAVYIAMELYHEARKHFLLSGRGSAEYLRHLLKQHGYYKYEGMIEKAERCWSHILTIKEDRY
jgi:tetratricopeptide (TPR) repeat protein